MSARVRRRPDYLRCYRSGRRRHGPVATLHFAPTDIGSPRLGITASRKVGGSVVRHRLKRQVREIYRRWKLRPTLPSVDYVVHLKPQAAAASFDVLRAEVLRLFQASLSSRRRK